MHKILALAIGLLGLLTMAAVALGDEAGPSPSGQIQTLDVTHSPNKASTKTKKVGTKALIKISLRKTDGTKPSPTVRTVVTIPKGMGLNYAKFPQCDAGKLRAQGVKGCPKGSKVGVGSIKADANPVVPDPVGGTVTAFNGKNKTYLIYVVPELSSPLVLPGKLKGRVLDVQVPLVPTLPGQPNATLTYFQITTGGTYKKGGKKYNYLENPTSCKGGYAWKMAFTYENGETLAPTSKAPCKK